MNTVLLLASEFERAAVPVDELGPKYFGMGPRVARQHAVAGTFPVHCFRTGGAKSPYMVLLTDLAQYLDEKRGAS